MNEIVSRVCTNCETEQPLTEFLLRKNGSGNSYRQRHCRFCENERRRERQKNNKEGIRNSELKYRYGITLDEYNALLESQDGVCAICGHECEVRENLSVDHDHETDEVRGLLCTSCNQGLGLFKDDPDLLVAAALYVLKPLVTTYDQ